jgi:hypothetical protein
MRTTTIAGRVALAVAVVLTACAPALSTGVNTAPDLKPAAYRTFTWDLPDQFPTGDPRLDNNPFFMRELQNAVALQLQGVGLREASGAADLTVHFHATVRNRVEVFESDQRAGYDQPGSHAQIHEYEEGTILVDVAERTSRKMIWRGWMQTDVSGTIADNAELTNRVRRGMTELFKKFPATVVAK